MGRYSAGAFINYFLINSRLSHQLVIVLAYHLTLSRPPVGLALYRASTQRAASYQHIFSRDACHVISPAFISVTCSRALTRRALNPIGELYGVM